MKQKESMFQLWVIAWVCKILSFLAVGGFIAIWSHGRVPSGPYWWHMPAFAAAVVVGIWAERKTLQTYQDVV